MEGKSTIIRAMAEGGEVHLWSSASSSVSWTAGATDCHLLFSSSTSSSNLTQSSDEEEIQLSLKLLLIVVGIYVVNKNRNHKKLLFHINTPTSFLFGFQLDLYYCFDPALFSPSLVSAVSPFFPCFPLAISSWSFALSLFLFHIIII